MATIDEARWLADVDLDEDARQEIPKDDQLQMLKHLAEYYVEMEEEIAERDEKLKVLHERFRKLREEIIPERMKEFGVRRFILDDGSELGYKEFYAGKVLDDAGYDWLEQNGYADAVKMEMKLEVSRVNEDVLNKVRGWLEDFEEVSIKQKQSIHHMTLGSVIKGLTKSGKQLPPDLIETFIGTRATLKGAKSDG